MSFADEMSLAFAPSKQQSWMEKLSRTLRQFLNAKMTSALKSRELRVEERISLGPKKSLSIVYCRGERFLVASSAESIHAVVALSVARSRSRVIRRTR